MCTKNSECTALVKLEPCDRNVDMSLKVVLDRRWGGKEWEVGGHW